MDAAIHNVIPYARRLSGFWLVFWLMLVFSLVGCTTRSHPDTPPKPETHPQPDVNFPPVAPSGMAQP